MLQDPSKFDVKILETDIDNVKMLDKSNFEYSMCHFILEVRKIKDGPDYPGATLYQFYMAIQHHLNENGVYWKIVECQDFKQLQVLDNVMNEKATMNIGMIKKQAHVILLDYKNLLWLSGALAEDEPDKLRSTVLFLLGINFSLRVEDEHYYLHRYSPDKESPLTFRYNDPGVRCAVYQKDTVMKTNDGGLKKLHKERKTVWVYPSRDIVCCPVHLVDKYMGLCPPVFVGSGKDNFYLRSLMCKTPAQWYSTRVLGINAIKKVIGMY